MVEANRERLSKIRRIDQLIAYLRDELDWPIESDSIEEITYDYTPDELGIDSHNAAKIETIKQLMPLSTNQPWGIFFVKFERKCLPVVALRRILSQLVIKKRASSRKSDKPSWFCNDLLFISSYGGTELRQISIAHFTENKEMGDLPTLKVLGWDGQDTNLHLDHVADELHTKLCWPDDERELEKWREQWTSAFTLRHKEVITTSRGLAVRLAELARSIRQRVNSALAIETETGPLRTLMKGFKEALIHDLEEDNFADMYAQTIAYGLLSARVSRPAGLVADNIADMVPVTNPFLKEMMETFLNIGGRKRTTRKKTFKGIDFDELGINDVVDLLRQANMEAVLRDFGNLNPQEDPVIHFYELFLKEYDPKMRMQRGVFYTPRPVVSFIVHSVDAILRKEFGLEDGLGDTTTWGEMIKRNPEIKLPNHAKPEDPFVQILDPATGTGTFLVEVIDLIYNSMAIKWKSKGSSNDKITSLWNEYVPKHLLPRLYGFELLMAPYAIAHMKIGLKLTETGYRFKSEQRTQIYLTNSLEPPSDIEQLTFLFEALAHEAEKANRVKRDIPFTVVVGNPPYSGISSNKGPWIDGLLKGRLADGKKIPSYYEVDGKPLGEKKLWLQDDYVKFIRYGQWLIENKKCGILGYISNHGYLDNPTFRGMRQQLMSTFPNISILDLHGNTKKRERAKDGSADKNVFDIEQGVSISLFWQPLVQRNSCIQHLDLFGERETKYEFLIRNSSRKLEFNLLNPNSPYYFFVPRDESNREEYETSPLLKDLVNEYSVGIVTARDSLTISFTANEIWERVQVFAGIDPEVARKRFNLRNDVRDWKVHLAQSDLKKSLLNQQYIKQILYRPFDIRYTYYTGRIKGFIGQPAKSIMRHFLLGKNIGLIATRRQSQQRAHWTLIGITDSIIESCAISNKTAEINYLFPLYLYSDSGTLKLELKRQPNFTKSFIQEIIKMFGLSWINEGYGNLRETIGPEDVLHYIYSQFHSQTYRSKYAEFLKMDFPRVFLTRNLGLFRVLCQYGADLVALHLLKEDYDVASWNLNGSTCCCPLKNKILKFLGEGTSNIDKGYPKYNNKKVYINPSQWFDGISESVWQFQIGGYQVCQKWLKDRGPKKGQPGRVLTKEDILHYQKIIVAINETVRLMAEIDKVTDKHGGWPGAFATK